MYEQDGTLGAARLERISIAGDGKGSSLLFDGFQHEVVGHIIILPFAVICLYVDAKFD